MRRSLYELYTLLVCLGSLIGIVATLCWLLFGVLAWSDPELTVSSYDYANHQTNEQFWESRSRRHGQQKDDPVKPSEEEITGKRLASYQSLLEGQRRFGKMLTILNGFGLVLSSVLFTIHWRLAKQARATVSEPASAPGAMGSWPHG
ncbi:MAG TPA: hypothetical protein VKD72_14895 [Gemmataceae bacterium]|nr:hypothetical protein [Gemmataceae bacterium]